MWITEVQTEDLRELNRTAKRLYGTSSLGITMKPLPKGCKTRLMIITDANHGRERTGKSQGGFWILLAEDSNSNERPIHAILLSWKSWMLKRVAVGTLDAEAQAAYEGCNEGIYMQNFLSWLWGIPNPEENGLALDLRVDCESLVEALATDKRVDNPRTQVQVQSIRDDVAGKRIRSVAHIAGKTNPVDIMTKHHDPLIRQRVHELMTKGILRDCC